MRTHAESTGGSMPRLTRTSSVSKPSSVRPARTLNPAFTGGMLLLLGLGLPLPAFAQTTFEWDPDGDTADLPDEAYWHTDGIWRAAGIPNDSDHIVLFSRHNQSDDDDCRLHGTATVGWLDTDADYDGTLHIEGALLVVDGPNTDGDVTWDDGGNNQQAGFPAGGRIRLGRYGLLEIDRHLTYGNGTANKVRSFVNTEGGIVRFRGTVSHQWTDANTTKSDFGRLARRERLHRHVRPQRTYADRDRRCLRVGRPPPRRYHAQRHGRSPRDPVHWKRRLERDERHR